MTWGQIQDHFELYISDLQEAFPDCSERDVQNTNADRGALVSLIARRSGLTEKEAEERLERWMEDIERKHRR
jgi:hypothetical protein